MSTSICKPIQKDDVLVGKSTLYKVLEFNGEGAYGTVAKCINIHTSKTVAIKIHKKPKDPTIKAEIEMLEAVRALDPEKANVVKFIDSFHFQGRSCLAFEMLDKSLWDLMKERQREPLSLSEIRPVAQQLLVAFQALKGIGIIHTDLKPDNVMLVNHPDQPFQVKLIDFGLALPVSSIQDGMTLQPICFRAPEVILGLHVSEAIDMWGLGCVLGFLYFGFGVIKGFNAYDNMSSICHLLGQPKHELLNVGLFTSRYFIPYCDEYKNLYWRLKTPQEYRLATGDKTPHIDVTWSTDLEAAVMNIQETQNPIEFTDRANFLNLLQDLLCVDPDQRIGPGQALQHPFISMMNLLDNGDSQYAKDAFDKMEIITRKIYKLAETDQKSQSDSWSDGYLASALESKIQSPTCEIPPYSWSDSHFAGFSGEIYPEPNSQENGPSCNSHRSDPEVPAEWNEGKYASAPDYMDLDDIQNISKEPLNRAGTASLGSKENLFLGSNDQDNHASWKSVTSGNPDVPAELNEGEESDQASDYMSLDHIQNHTEEPSSTMDAASLGSNDLDDQTSLRNSINCHTNVYPSTTTADAMNLNRVSNSTKEHFDGKDEASPISSGNETPGISNEDDENNSTKAKKTRMNTLQDKLRQTGTTLVQGFHWYRKLIRHVFPKLKYSNMFATTSKTTK